MKTGVLKGFGLLAAIGAGSFGVLLFACSSSSSGGGTPTPMPSADAAGVSFCAATCTADTDCPMGDHCTSGGTCAPIPGNYPASECESSDLTGCQTTSTCTIDETICGSKSTCLPMADNSNKMQQDFRLRRLTVISPPALAKPFVQKGVLDQGISLHANGKPLVTGGPATPTCGENGDGAFNWLLRLDKASGKITTGGAPPSADPFGTGYCFVNGNFANIAVSPVTKEFTMNADGTFSAGPVDNLNVPIFVHGDVNNVVVLPLHQASFHNVKVSTDGNCIGSFNYGALDSQCIDVRENCSKWHTDGSLGGYITLEEADKVNVSDLHATLCVLLTASTGVDPGNGGLPACKRDSSGKIAFQGDYCSTTKSAGGCNDAFWLSATFAASAIKINDGTGVAQCTGSAPPMDAGTD